MRVEVKKGADGVFYARPYLGRTPEGKIIQPYKSFPSASTREEAQSLADTWAANLTADGMVKSARLVDLLGEYIDLRARNGASPNSVKSYRLFLRGYVARFIGTANARDLGVADFNRFEQRLLVPRDRGGAGLCRNSVLAVHNFLRGAYNHFVKAGVCEYNPMIYVAKPSPERYEAAALSEWDFASVDAALESALRPEVEDAPATRSAALAFASWLALRTGMRCGEVCAVQRREVYRRSMYVHVGGTVIEEAGVRPYRKNVTKGRKCRNVSVTERDMAVIDAFTALQDRVYGAMPPDAHLVTVDGGCMRPTTVSAAFSRIRDSLGLPKGMTFHGLRHTHATWCLANGVDLKTLSERLGHADEATTLRIYAHVLPGRDALAARAFGDAAEQARGGGS